MNSNYQVNKLYAHERINSHLQAAEAHRLAQQSKGKSQARIAVDAAVRVYREAGNLVSKSALALVTLAEAAVSIRRPHLR